MNAHLTAVAGALDRPVGVRRREPHGSLLTYYLLVSLLFGPLFPIWFLSYYFRYRSLRYEFDGEGVTMRWGILFRKEISLTYARIQDIHLTSNVVERWLGLAKIQIQTASGSAGAEMTIEGLKDFEAIRNDLYLRMRGVKDGPRAVPGARSGSPPELGVRGSFALAPDHGAGSTELIAAIEEAAAELRRLRESLADTTALAGGDRGDV
jgi:putative membrane protein